MEETRFRNKVTCFTFALSILVVLIHGYNIILFMDGASLEGFGRLVFLFENFMADVLGPVAVPGFFMLSAYLFYRGFRWEKLGQKLHSRVKSILIPYIVWNALYYFGYVVLRRIPALEGIVGQGQVPFSVFGLVDAIVNFTYNPVFWYLYQLILLTALAPLLYLVLRNRRVGAAFLAVLCILIHWRVDLGILNGDALLYYGFSAWMGLHGRSFAEEASWGKELCGMLGIGLAILCYQVFQHTGLVLLIVGYRLLLPVSIWLLVPADALKPAKSWMKQGFFLYAIHFGIVRGLGKGLALVLPHTPAVALATYLLIPVVTVAVAWWLSGLLKKKIPPLWSVLGGGRD